MSGCRLLTFDDPYAYQATLGAAAKIVLTGVGKFETRIMLVGLPQVQLRSGRITVPGIEYSESMPNQCGLTFFYYGSRVGSLQRN